ncbi:MAG: RsmE family RNA methyltransferase [candidate division Zixibacteria bacterium]|nr:RsmE family RNA methyltransferase [candidate division Zixibacteria bacterium]
MEIKATYFIASPADINDDSLILRNSEAHHLSNVLRGDIGDRFYAVDGAGNRYLSEISKIEKKSVTSNILKTDKGIDESSLHISLALPLLKGARMDYALEKATECGVADFIPYNSTLAVSDVSDKSKADKKKQRWNNIIRAAVKQSLRCRIPDVRDLIEFDDLITHGGDYELRLIADLSEDSISTEELKIDSDAEKALMIVGPEAGFTEGELETAENAGFVKVKFGERRLRAETACAVFPFLLQFAARRLN